MKKPLFICFDGVDAAGKSTQITRLAAHLRQNGTHLICTREPGGTVLGEQLRELILHSDEGLSPHCQLLLLFAARLQHLEQHIRPALAQGQWVLCDRFSDSSFAYQGGGGGVNLADIAQLEAWTLHGFRPHLTFIFDLPYEISQQRRQLRAQSLDRFEQQDRAFYERVRQVFLQRAAAHTERYRLIDAREPEHLVFQKILAELQSFSLSNDAEARV